MSVDFEKLTENELCILDALEGMFFQYGWGSPLADKAFDVLSWYELYSLVDEKCEPVPFRSTELYHLVNVDTVEERNRAILFNGLKLPLDSLNARSIHSLHMIAAFADQHLKYEDINMMYHMSMSAGEHAFLELKAYGLLQCDDRGWGTWTAQGLKMVRSFPRLGRFPGWESPDESTTQ